jgi:hypothetical protein
MFCREFDDCEIDQHVRNLKAFGYTRVDGAMTAEGLAGARSRLKGISHEAAGPDSMIRIDDIKLRGVIFNMQNRGKFFVDLISDLAVHKICMPFLNDPYYEQLSADVPNYILANYTARSSQSDAPLQIHIDSFIPTPGPRTWAMQAIFMLDDQTVENGCSYVVPGTHRSGDYTDRDLDQKVPVESKAGDLILWDSRLWHGALPNTDGASRWALIATFHMWWMKQKLDIPRMLPEDIYADLSDLQKQLLGYCALPPTDVEDGIETKRGYEALRPTVADYFKG